MSPELDAKLCEKYPTLFQDRRAPMTHTAMCWGFECGEGWFALLDALCYALTNPVRQAEADLNLQREHPTAAWVDLPKAEAHLVEVQACAPVAVQVKEKFGTLRFYINGGDDTAYALIGMAERLSALTCEKCGVTRDVSRNSNGWIQTLCATCRGHALAPEEDENV